MANHDRPGADDDSLDTAEERLIALLSSHQETLESGRAERPGGISPDSLDPHLRRQFEQGRLVLERLARVRRDCQGTWPSSPVGTTAIDVAADGRPRSEASGTLMSIDELPKSVGRFEIVRELGRGGLGMVFLAHDPLLKLDVALKIPRPEALFTPGLRRRFAREAQAAARLTHPNLVAVYEVGEAGPVCYLAAALCNGPTLAAWLATRQTPVPPRLAAQLVAHLADGIEYAHSQGVLHRDLKPSNVLLEARGEAGDVEPLKTAPDADFPFTPKIADFGLAHVEDLAAGETRTGLVIGTPGYMAPEQAEGRTREIGPATDVYGLGAILYELLVGRPAFRGTNDLDTLRKLVGDEPVHPRRTRPKLPRDLEAICLKCLEKQPARRYLSAGQLADDLRRFLMGEPTEGRPVSVVGRMWKWARRRPTAAALLAVTLLAAALLLGGSLVYSARVTDAYVLAEQNRREAESQRSETDSQRREAEAQRHEAETRRAEAQSLVRDLRREVYVKDMGRALQTWQQGDAQHAIALLDSYRPQADEEDLRGFEWHHLMRRFKDQGRTLLGHLGPVHHVAASPDGTLVATAGDDGRIQLWNVDRWKIRTTLRGHKHAVNWISFSPDGTQLASAGDDGTIRTWNVSTREARTVSQCDDKMAAVVYTPDGLTLIVASRGGRLSWLDTRSWTERTSLDCQGTVKSLVLAPDGKEMAISFDTAPSEQWDLTTTPPTRLSEAPHVRAPQLAQRYIVQYLLDGQGLVAGTSFGLLVFLPRNSPPPEALRTRQLWSKSLDVIAVAPNGRTLAAAGAEGVVRLVDIATFEESQTCVGHLGPVRSLAWLPDGETLVSASEDGTVKVWRPRQSAQAGEVACELPFTANSSPICTARLKFDASGQRLWFGTVEGVWNIELATRITTRRLSASPSTGELCDVSYALAPGSDRVLVCSETGLRQVWDLATERILFTVPLDEKQLPRLRETFGGHHAYFANISPDGKWVVAPNPAGDVNIWNVDTGQQMLRLSKRYAKPVFYSRFSPDGRLVVVGTTDDVDLFDAATGAQMAEYKNSHTPVFSPDSRFFIHEVVGRNNGFRLALTDQPRTSLRDLQLPRTRETVLAITHDGRTFVTFRPIGPHSELCLWSATAGQPMIVLAANRPENILAAAFSPDGSMLAALGNHVDQWKVFLWRATAPDSAARSASGDLRGERP